MTPGILDDDSFKDLKSRCAKHSWNKFVGNNGKTVVFCAVCGTTKDDDHKQDRYQDANGEDWIDECARTFTKEEFRGAMRFNIGKYNRRVGKKDTLESNISKIKDYADRWLQYEKGES